MPVLQISLKRFAKMVGADRRKILDRLPYIGLDIEGVDGDSVRVEYSPNRPDFGTDYGVARAMRGLLGKEVGLPRFPVSSSGISVSVDRRLSKVRPFIACAAATGLRLDSEDVRQIISLQEDLHNGLGRKRRVVAIGLHDMDAVKPPFDYRAVDASFKFITLGGGSPMSVRSILEDTTEGRAYGPALGATGLYPMITDSKGVVLSFPPVINGDATKVTPKTTRMFVDVTSTDKRVGDDVLAILATTLSEARAKMQTVSIRYPSGPVVTPDLTPTEIALEEGLVKSLLGLDLTRAEIVKSLAKSRLGVKGRNAVGPRYRIDLLHPVDIAEEVALGYGMDRIGPLYPPSERPGSFDRFEDFLDSASTIMAGEGMLEMMTYELTDEGSLYAKFGRPSSEKVTVQNPKSLDHSVLRDALIPGLMSSLSGNVKSDYPQRIFEIGRVYRRSDSGVVESWHLGCLVAHSQASYTEAKMYLEATCRILAGKEITSPEGVNWSFAQGRCGTAVVDRKQVGFVGEVAPETIEAFGLGVPVSGFEIDLSALYELLK